MPQTVNLHPSKHRNASFNRVAVAFCTAFCLLAIIAGCKGESSSSAAKSASSDDATSVLVQLNWYPESEHGGVYAAEADGYYDEAKLDVSIRPGGPATRIAAELATGRVQFAFANADDVVLFRKEGVDAVAVLAAMQNHPRCILVRADAGVNSFQDLKGMILQRQPGRPFVSFLEKQGLLEGVQLVPYQGSIAALANDPKTAIQAYSFAEPILAKEKGIEVKTLMVSDLGWNPYSSVLVTTGELIRTNPEMVKSFVQASQKGWQQYLQDPAKANEAILKANQEGVTAATLQFGYEGLKQLALPDGFSLEQVGQMDKARWQTLVDQMTDLGLINAGEVTADSLFTNQFLN